MSITKKVLIQMLDSAADVLIANKDKLSEIDSKFGDGDHGVTMEKISILIKKETANWQDESLKGFIESLSEKIMAIGGGSAGPLYGTLVEGFSLPLSDDTSEINNELLKKMLQGSKDSMFEITTARIGDKTMMDALIPATEGEVLSCESISETLEKAAKASKEGSEKTAAMVSKFGRARSYGDKTLGTQDAGALSTSLFFHGICEGFKKSLL